MYSLQMSSMVKVKYQGHQVRKRDFLAILLTSDLSRKTVANGVMPNDML